MSHSDTAGLGRFESESKRRRSLETPEGVVLGVMLALHGNRLAALALDIAFWMAATLVLWLLVLVTVLKGSSASLVMPFLVLVGGLIRNFYFLFFELTWQGRTPGKRLLGLRVIDNRGGPLRTGAVVARNLTREIEVALPLSLAFLSGGSTGGSSGLAGLLLFLWFCLFAGFPLFNRDRMRCGDLIAGTWVVEMPPVSLGEDLAVAASRERPRNRLSSEPRRHGEPEAFSFSDEQLARYEVVHLRVLEDVLRRPDVPASRQLRRQIAENIARKIGYEGRLPEARTLDFLTAFYAQFRNRLERERLYHGAPRED